MILAVNNTPFKLIFIFELETPKKILKFNYVSSFRLVKKDLNCFVFSQTTSNECSSPQSYHLQYATNDKRKGTPGYPFVPRWELKSLIHCKENSSRRKWHREGGKPEDSRGSQKQVWLPMGMILAVPRECVSLPVHRWQGSTTEHSTWQGHRSVPTCHLKPRGTETQPLYASGHRDNRPPQNPTSWDHRVALSPPRTDLLQVK